MGFSLVPNRLVRSAKHAAPTFLGAWLTLVLDLAFYYRITTDRLASVVDAAYSYPAPVL